MLIHKSFIILLLSCTFVAFYPNSSIKGTYQYAGGIYNGKPEGPSKDYKLMRIYDGKQYQGKFIAIGEDTIVYEKGNYQLAQDTCLETQTYSAQPSKWLNLTLHYQYQLKNDTLTFSGKLPNGTTVQEYWKKLK